MDIIIDSKLKWQCRRGLLELDIILLSFLDNVYPKLSPKLQAQFGQLIAYTDPELLVWLVQRVPVPCIELQEIADCVAEQSFSPSTWII